MGITKTDFMRGMQCERMLWLDKHHPEYKIIPPETKMLLDKGNEFGDAAMGIFGDFVEVKEYYKGTTNPNKKAMAKKTEELLALETPVICEAAFFDKDKNYCAADIIRKANGNSYDLFEVKNSSAVSEGHIKDAAYQARLIRASGLNINKIHIIYHGPDENNPFVIEDVTEKAESYISWINDNLMRLNVVKNQEEEIVCHTGEQCNSPYSCWYYGFCQMKESGNLEKPRCSWCNIGNPLYVSYHDNEWGVPCHDDHDLYELFILESFQAGLSWEIVLNKRNNFRAAYDGFDINKVCNYGDDKVNDLLQNRGIVRNRAKIKASISNSKIFKEIQTEFGSFDKYIWGFNDGEIIYESDPKVTTSPLSDRISEDMKKRGMQFAGSTIIYSYLQAIGIINAHMDGCFKSPV